MAEVEKEEKEEQVVSEPKVAEDKNNTKDGVAEQTKGEKPEEPQAPKPEFKISQIIPMVAMLGLQKIDLEKLGYVRHIEVLFVIVQLACLLLLYQMYRKIQTIPDGGVMLQIPEVKQFGQVVTPPSKCTAKEYDMGKLQEQLKQSVVLVMVLGGTYYKWGSLMPLVLQILMTPTQLYESPLCQLHVLGKDVTRPFAQSNPFGMPTAPEPPAQPVGDSTEAGQKKDQ